MSSRIASLRFIVMALLSIAGSFFWLCLAAYFSEPNAEDFALSITPREDGKINSIISLLTFFDSRYSANLLHAINPLVYNYYKHFYILPVFCLVLLAGSLWFFIDSLFKSRGSRFMILITALLFVSGYYATIPSLTFGLYYMSSTFTYLYPVFFWFVWMGCLLRSFKTKGIRFIMLTVGGLVSLIFSFGCTELFIVINAFTLLMALLLCLPVHRHRFFTALPYFLVALACLWFILNMPSRKFTPERLYGNLSERYPDSNFVVTSLWMYGNVWLRSWLHPFTLLLIPTLTFFYCKMDLRYTSLMRISNRRLLWLFIVLQIFSWMLCWTYFISRGSLSEEPLYIFNVALLLSDCGFFILLPYLFSRFELVGHFKQQHNYTLPLIGAGLAFCTWFFAPSYRLIRHEYQSGQLSEMKSLYHQFYHDVDSVKRQNSRPFVVVFPQPIRPPRSNYLEGDLLPNRQNKDWNHAYEIYFGVDEVRLPNDTLFK